MNFCTRAIESFQSLRTDNMQMGFKADSEGIDWLIKVLLASVKFKLPDGGRLIDKCKGNQHFSEMLRLPFNEVVLEYTMMGESAAEDHQACPKRIALCLSSESLLLHPSMAKVLTNHGGNGIFVISLWLDDIQNNWITSGGGFFLACGQDSANVPLSETYLERMQQKGMTDKDFSNDRWEGDSFHFLPSLYERLVAAMGGDSEKVEATIASDTNDEMMGAIEFCAIMNCSNVRYDMVAAPTKLNKKRLANDKPPMFEYRILVLESDGEGIVRISENATTSCESSRTSCRLHVRRGHIRRLKERTIWINQMSVGIAKHGVVAKEYKIVRS